MKVPLVDLKAQHESLKGELLDAVSRVIDQTSFILGHEVRSFEQEFAAFQGTPFAIGVASGLDALTLSLRGVGLGPGCDVVVPANTFVATALAVSQVGARVRLADVDPQSFNVTADTVRRALTPDVKAVIPVHLYGQIAEMDAIRKLCDERGIAVVEDAAQAHGATSQGCRAGAWGRTACFSFYPAKNLGALGDAGAIVTHEPALVERIQLLRNYGSRVKYEHVERGYNSRLDAVQAALLRVKLRHLDAWNSARRRAAAIYDERLADTGLILPAEGKGRTHVYHLYVVRVSDPRALHAYLAQRGVGTGFHYPIPIHRLQAYEDLGYSAGSFPVTEHLARTILSLPMYPEITVDQIDYVCEHVRAALEKGVTDLLAA